MTNNSPTLASMVEQLMNPNNSKWATNEAMRAKRYKYLMYQRMLTELALNRFKWYGVPPEIDPTFIERTLLFRSLCIFTYDPDLGYKLLADPVVKHDLISNSPQGS